jgi:hypothetical protein
MCRDDYINSTRARQSASLVTREAGHDVFPSPTFFSTLQVLAPALQIPWSPLGGWLIANPRLESELSRKDPKQLQISNRERMAICRFTPSSRTALFRPSPATRHSLVLRRPRANEGSLANSVLIVTPRLESPATPTKQNSNRISNRYKSPVFAPLSGTSPITRHASLLPQPPGKL